MRAPSELEAFWREWVIEIPYLRFPFEWEIAAMPPFAGALIRDRIRLADKPQKYVSVYLDVDASLGVVEILPPPPSRMQSYPSPPPHPTTFA
jgi:hypothetical protein